MSQNEKKEFGAKVIGVEAGLVFLCGIPETKDNLEIFDYLYERNGAITVRAVPCRDMSEEERKIAIGSWVKIIPPDPPGSFYEIVKVVS